jgi:hypothetical protein
MSRRLLGLIAAVSIAALVVAGAIGYAVTHQGAATPTTALGAPHFVDETASAGVDQVYDGGEAFAVGGGVAVDSSLFTSPGRPGRGPGPASWSSTTPAG